MIVVADYYHYHFIFFICHSFIYIYIFIIHLLSLFLLFCFFHYTRIVVVGNYYHLDRNNKNLMRFNEFQPEVVSAYSYLNN